MMKNLLAAVGVVALILKSYEFYKTHLRQGIEDSLVDSAMREQALADATAKV